MAIATHDIPAGTASIGRESGWPFIDWLARIGDRAYATSAAAACAREAGRLSAMTDEELAEVGIAREDIVQHAFRSLPLY